MTTSLWIVLGGSAALVAGWLMGYVFGREDGWRQGYDAGYEEAWEDREPKHHADAHA